MRRYTGLFVSDLDGTLLNNKRQITPTDVKALARLQESGYLVAIATGRSNFSFNTLMNTLGYSEGNNSLPLDYVIFSTGAGIMDCPGRNLLKHYSLTYADVHRIVGRFDALNLDYMIHSPVPDTRYFKYRYYRNDNPDFHTRLSMYSEYGTALSSTPSDLVEGATGVLCIVPESSGHQVATQLVDLFKEYSVIKATSPLDGRSVWVEIFAPEVSKSQAVKWLADRLTISRKHIFAVGNDYNDEDLLQMAAIGYVVENSPASLRSRFHTVASNQNGGVAEAVTHLLNR